MNQMNNQSSQQWLTEAQAAELLNVSTSMLAKNRCYAEAGEIIPYVRLSKRCIRYSYTELNRWLEDQLNKFKVGEDS